MFTHPKKADPIRSHVGPVPLPTLLRFVGPCLHFQTRMAHLWTRASRPDSAHLSGTGGRRQGQDDTVWGWKINENNMRGYHMLSLKNIDVLTRVPDQPFGTCQCHLVVVLGDGFIVVLPR